MKNNRWLLVCLLALAGIIAIPQTAAAQQKVGGEITLRPASLELVSATDVDFGTAQLEKGKTLELQAKNHLVVVVRKNKATLDGWCVSFTMEPFVHQETATVASELHYRIDPGQLEVADEHYQPQAFDTTLHQMGTSFSLITRTESHETGEIIYRVPKEALHLRVKGNTPGTIRAKKTWQIENVPR